MIPWQIIDRQLRPTGRLLHLLLPAFSLRTFHLANWFLDRFFAGRNVRGLRCETVWLPRPDKTLLRVRVYRTKSAPPEPVPGLLWLHGGGYALGVPEQDDKSIRDMIEACGCVVVAPDYTRSVDAPFPAALDDSYLALSFLKTHAMDYGVRADQLFIGGGSAGGGLTAATALLARDRGEIAVAFQMPLYPMLDDRLTASSRANDMPVWNTRSNECAWRLYLGDAYQTDGVSPYAAPARATDYAGLPPICTFIGSVEPFYDETVAFVKALQRAHVPVSFEVYEGCYHAFNTMAAKADVSRAANAFVLSALTAAAKTCFAEQKG